MTAHDPALVETVAEALWRHSAGPDGVWPDGCFFPDHVRDTAHAALDAITTSHALVELPNVSGVNFTHEDGTPYTPDELRYFAGEAIAAAESGSTATENQEAP